MPPTLQDLGLDRLSVEDRIALAQALWDSVAQEVEQAPLPEAQRKELERRLADSIARPDAVTPWEEIKARALARARK
jgi:putative addiction module component (TIGR02574 family)